jgi:transcriptional regulator with XRE-family HTH domain
MTQINRDRLKYYRQQANLSMDALAAKSHLNKSTIQRIERGEGGTDPRERTVTELAHALQVSPSDLTSSDPIAITKPAKDTTAKSQLNIRMGSDARNALAFVSARYGVKQATVLHLAPLLFALVAEESLAKRSEQLEKLRELGITLGAIPKAMERSMADFYQRESASIEARDIFGNMLDDEDMQRWECTDHADYVGIYNPLALHIHQRVAQTGATDSLVDWDPDIGPEYKVGSEIALQFAGGDEEIANMLTSGAIGIHEMPSDVRASEDPEPRMKWLREKRDQVIDARNRPNPFIKRLNLTGTEKTSDA